MAALLGQLFKSNPNAKMVQAAFATTQSNDADLRQNIDCTLRIRRATDLSEVATIQELGAINDYHLSLHGLGSDGSIVGQFRKPLGAPSHAFIWPSNREIRDLGTLGGSSSNALHINGQRQVVGSSDASGSSSHAFLWDESEGMHDLGTLGGRDSVARSINDRSQIVGSSFVEAGGSNEERAFLWTPTAGKTRLGDQFEGWSRAVAINATGIVLGWRQLGPVVCGFIWSPEFGAVDIVGQGGRAFFPCAITDSGLVLGEGDDNSGKRRTFVWTRVEGLRQLPVPDDFHPCDVDERGVILGNVYSRPWSHPAIYTSLKGSLALPLAEEHHTTAKAMNRSGTIIGAAWKGPWKHSHPILWRLDLPGLSI